VCVEFLRRPEEFCTAYFRTKAVGDELCGTLISQLVPTKKT